MASRRMALLLLVAVVAAACGARLDDDERTEAIRALAGAADTTDAIRTGPADGLPFDTGATGTPGVAGPGAAPGTGAPGVTGDTGSAGVPTGDATGPVDAGDVAVVDEACRGGATDVGVTENRVVIATLADVTGPAPGLFRSAHQAVQAFATFVNSQGGICGRQIQVVQLDSKTDSGGTRTAVLDACNQAFALVGSMSAFDAGGASAVEDCGIPDVSAIVVNTDRLETSWTFPAFPSRQDLLGVGNAVYIAEQFPEAVGNAAILWLNTAVTRSNAQARKDAWEAAGVGYNFKVEREVQTLEANYTPIVLDLKDKGVEYVTMVADNNSISRLMKAARQQGWAPTVWDWDSVAYDPKFLENVGVAGEGAHVFINSAMFEEAGANPEMARYLEWLGRTSPGAQPDYFGGYAWSAAGLFFELLRAMGPEPTRAELQRLLQNMGPWDGNGMHGPHEIGVKRPTTCFLYMQIRDGAFQRVHPSSGWDCDRAGLVSI